MTVVSAVGDESTVTYINANGTELGTDLNLALANAFPWKLHQHFDIYTILGGQAMSQTTPSVAYISQFFRAIFAKAPLETFYGPDPASTARLIDAIKAIYRPYMAQVASKLMRNASTSPLTRIGHWQNPDRAMVRQDRTSKLILQALLAAIVVLGVAAWYQTDAHKVLPHNPCSIAGLASLLAGSEMCAMQNQEGWEKEKFALKWWEEENGTRRFGIDIVGRPELYEGA